MRIGIMLRSLEEKKGIGVYTKNILESLLQVDGGNEYVLLHSSRDSLGKYSRHMNVRERFIDMRTKFLWDQLAMPYVVTREKLDVLFNPKFTIPLLAPCKTVTVLHGSEWFVYPSFYKRWDVMYVKTIMPLYLKWADAVIAVSNRAKQDIVAYTGVDPNKIKTVYSAPSKHFTYIQDKARLESIQKKYSLPQHYILHVGFIYPGKNIGNVLKAFARVRKQIPHKLVLVGGKLWKFDGDLRFIHELGIENEVIFTGWVPQEELPAFYNMADLFLFPSMYESCSIALLEAMASGCPVVTSNTGGTPEITGDAAILVDPKDVDAIADAVCEVLTNNDLKQSLAEKGLEQAKKFSWESAP